MGEIELCIFLVILLKQRKFDKFFKKKISYKGSLKGYKIKPKTVIRKNMRSELFLTAAGVRQEEILAHSYLSHTRTKSFKKPNRKQNQRKLGI